MSDEKAKRPVGRPRKDKPGISFAYGVYSIPKETSLDKRGEQLTVLGKLGWEIVSIIAEYDGTHTAYMMKEIK